MSRQVSEILPEGIHDGLGTKDRTGIAALALVMPGAQPTFAQNSGRHIEFARLGIPQGGYVLKVNRELVLTNVVARDAKTGEIVHGLKQSDFSIYENGKQQQIATLRLPERGYGNAAE